jgi:hypothetical protein
VRSQAFFRVLAGTGGHLIYRLLDFRQALRRVGRSCRGRTLVCRWRGAVRRLCFQIVNPRGQLVDQLQALIELLFEYCDAIAVIGCSVSDWRMTETRHEQRADP